MKFFSFVARSMYPLLLAAATAFATALPTSSLTTVQSQPQQDLTLTSRVNVVSILATVHDREGKVVKNLIPDDFILLEDGVPQKIAYFSKESDLPLIVGLLVDTSTSQTGVLEQERRASATFLDQVLREDKDQAFVMHFDKHVEILQGLTSSHAEIAAALKELKIPEQVSTLIYTAVKQSSEDVMRQQRGRKAFILLTDGVAFKEPTSIATAIEFAQRADTILYSIRFSDPIPVYKPVWGAILAMAKEHGKRGLLRMARETGGISYEVAKGQTMEQIYAQIEEALRNQYSIGYTPAHSMDDGKYHKLKLTTKDRHLTVHARQGYYAK